MIDRIAPTYRPAGKNDGTQRWQSLLFCHWEVSIDAIRQVVPDELQIDTFDDRAYIGIVPFKMRDIRPYWLPRQLAFNFLETNVRTYVVHRDRPGVYFFSLEASSRLAVWAARIGWSLPYFYARMDATVDQGRKTYSSHRPGNGAQHRISFRIRDELGASQPDSLEHFLLERYLLFVEHKKQICVGQVHHDPYEVYTADVDEIDDGLLSQAGLPPVDRLPDLAHYCPGVDVEVFGIKLSV